MVHFLSYGIRIPRSPAGPGIKLFSVGESLKGTIVKAFYMPNTHFYFAVGVMGLNLETSTAELWIIASGLSIECCKADSSKSLQRRSCSAVIDDAKGLWKVGDNWDVSSEQVNQN